MTSSLADRTVATPTGAAPPETGRHGHQFWPGWLAAPAAVALFLAAVVPLLFTIFLSLTASEDGGYLNRTFAGGAVMSGSSATRPSGTHCGSSSSTSASPWSWSW